MQFRRKLTIYGCGALALTAAVAWPARMRSQAGTLASRRFTFTDTIHMAAAPGDSKELRVWIPIPYEESSQAVSRVKMEGSLHWKVLTDPEYQNRFVYIMLAGPALAKDLNLKATVHVQRFEQRAALDRRDDDQVPPTVTTPRFLQPDRLVSLDGEIPAISNREAGGIMLPLDKARKLYDYVISTMHSDGDDAETGRGDSTSTLKSAHGDSADISSLYIALARGSGIPARFEIGFAIPTDAREGVLANYHCWAQIYLQGIGWVPVDPADGARQLDKRDYYFGAADADRVKLTMGRDVRLSPPQKGAALNYFAYPYAELDGKPYTAITNEYSFKDDSNSGPATEASAPAR
jgi:transglutaminase-like putative cysteine protease